MELEDHDIEIDGYVMGRKHPVFAEDVDTGQIEVRDQDSLNPVGNNIFFGKDYLTPPTWIISIATKAETAENGLDALGHVSRIWRAPRGVGKDIKLRYCVAGRTRFVYGRPRTFGVTPTGAGLNQGIIRALGEFKLTDTYHYEDLLKQVRVDIVPPATGGGLTAPFVAPMVTTTNGVRQGLIEDSGGNIEAPFELTVHGPISNPVIEAEGWRIALTTDLAWDQSLTVDTRKMTITRNDGASLAGTLSRRSRLENARIHPGANEFTFTGSDPTGTAYMTISWHPAWTGF